MFDYFLLAECIFFPVWMSIDFHVLTNKKNGVKQRGNVLHHLGGFSLTLEFSLCGPLGCFTIIGGRMDEKVSLCIRVV